MIEYNLLAPETLIFFVAQKNVQETKVTKSQKSQLDSVLKANSD